MAGSHRRNFGELVENLAGSGEYHWMAGNFLKYARPLTPNDRSASTLRSPAANVLADPCRLANRAVTRSDAGLKNLTGHTGHFI
jgi:hypothetical protein